MSQREKFENEDTKKYNDKERKRTASTAKPYDPKMSSSLSEIKSKRLKESSDESQSSEEYLITSSSVGTDLSISITSP